MVRTVRETTRKAWTWVYEALVAYGRVYMVPLVPDGGTEPNGPPPGHPERLCPHALPDPAEARLWADLRPHRRFGCRLPA
jgi:hypothetical protein